MRKRKATLEQLASGNSLVTFSEVEPVHFDTRNVGFKTYRVGADALFDLWEWVDRGTLPELDTPVA